MGKSAITPEFRVSYPAMFTAKKNELSGKDEFSCVALFSAKTDLSVLRKLAEEVINEKWPNANKRPKLRTPFRDQAEREKTNDDGSKYLPDGYERGGIFINLKSTTKPGLIGRDKKPITEETEFYAGCYARASITCFAYEKKGNAGISFGLSNVQKLRDGNPISGRARAEDEFEALEPLPIDDKVDPFS